MQKKRKPSPAKRKPAPRLARQKVRKRMVAIRIIPGVLVQGQRIIIESKFSAPKFSQDIVYVRVGYNDWHRSLEPDVELERVPGTNLFVGEFHIPDYVDSLDMCFHNGHGEWENNNGKNWHFPVRQALDTAAISFHKRMLGFRDDPENVLEIDDPRLRKYEELTRLIANPEFRRDLDAALSNPFEVAVMATMKAGKSTLINAFLGQELLPTKTEACTAIVYRLEDVDTHNEMRCRAVVGEHIQDWEPASADNLAKWNESGFCSLVEIEGNMPFIKNEGARLVLYDTPGPNNARDARHAEVALRFLREGPYGMIMYIMNAEQIASTDDQRLLKSLREAQMTSIKQGKPKDVVFVLNRIDRFDEETSRPLEDVLEDARNYLTGEGFENPILLPLTAQAALLCRRALRNDPLTLTESRACLNYIEMLLQQPDRLIHLANIPGVVRKRMHGALYTDGSSELQSANRVKRVFSSDSTKDIPSGGVVNIRGNQVEISTLHKAIHASGMTCVEGIMEFLLHRQVFPDTLKKIARILDKHNAPAIKQWISTTVDSAVQEKNIAFKERDK